MSWYVVVFFFSLVSAEKYVNFQNSFLYSKWIILVTCFRFFVVLGLALVFCFGPVW